MSVYGLIIGSTDKSTTKLKKRKKTKLEQITRVSETVLVHCSMSQSHNTHIGYVANINIIIHPTGFLLVYTITLVSRLQQTGQKLAIEVLYMAQNTRRKNSLSNNNKNRSKDLCILVTRVCAFQSIVQTSS